MILIASLTAAQAQQIHTSEPAEMLFEDTFQFLNFATIDTGYLPSQNDPISVRFTVTPSGGVVTEMEAISNMEWPTAFKHSLTAIPGEGIFGIDTAVDMEFDVYINVPAISFQQSIPIWTESFSLTQGMAFDTLVLPGSSEYPLVVAVQNTNLIDPFEYDFDVLAGVAGLAFQVEVYPELSSTMSGNRIETELDAFVGTQDGEGGFALLDPPSGNPGAVFLQSTYYADLTTTLAVVIEPSAELTTIIGDFELIAFDIPVEAITDTRERAFTPAVYTHALPALEEIDLASDLGEVAIGNLRNLEVPLENLGALGLEGTASIEGSETFTVWPQYFYATQGNVDGLVVTFAPTEEGEELATLVIESNDPVLSEVRIPLTGTGFDDTPVIPEPDPVPEPPEPPGLSSEEAKGCGCDASPSPVLGGLLLPGLLFIRRR